MDRVRRTTRDGFITHANRTTDALRPLAEAVRNLEASFDRAAERIEDARQAKVEQRVKALVDESVRGLYAEAEAGRADSTFKRLGSSRRMSKPSVRVLRFRKVKMSYPKGCMEQGGAGFLGGRGQANEPVSWCLPLRRAHRSAS